MRTDFTKFSHSAGVVRSGRRRRSKRWPGFKVPEIFRWEILPGQNKQSKPYRSVVADILRRFGPRTVLDAPCGAGFLRQCLDPGIAVDGVDLYCPRPEGYRNFWRIDLDAGLPDGMPDYDCIVCCEAISYLGNPLLFLRSARRRLKPGGVLIVTTPSIWYPGARLQFLWRGFFPAFPWPSGKADRRGPFYIHPYSYPQLHLYLKLSGFANIRLHPVDNGPKHLYEWILGFPQVLYSYLKRRRSGSEEEKSFWRHAGSVGCVYGRRLVVTAEAAAAGEPVGQTFPSSRHTGY